MELQQQLGEFEAAGIAVFAVSYDPVDALAGFAGEFGILNTLIGADEPVYGIPFPGSYVVDEDGRVAEKFFHREYQVRETGATVLHSGFNIPVDLGGYPHAEAAEAGVRVSVALAGGKLKYMQRIDLEDGRHVNGQPAPEGYFATEVRVSGPERSRGGVAPGVPDL